MTAGELSRVEVWQAKLLCCRYLFAQFEVASVQGHNPSGCPDDSTVAWAVGQLRDGTYEPLGVWPISTIGSPPWDAVVDDLAARGLERIEHLGVHKTCQAVAGGSAVLTRLGSSAGIPPRFRGKARKFDSVTADLRVAVNRIVARRSHIGPKNTALCVAKLLMRTESATQHM